MSDESCTRCDRIVPGYDGVFRSDGRGRSLGFVCGRGWSAQLGQRRGEDIQHLELDPIVLLDASGRPHEFRFRYIPAPRGLEAFELVDGHPGGYKFQVLQEADDPGIVRALLDRMQRALARRYLEPCALDPDRYQITGNTLSGRIEWAFEEDDQLPAVVIDGQKLSWIELGAMLMGFEGWQFRLDILDLSEEP